MPLTFSETDVAKLFGHEAAEDENPARLREYYFKTATYEQVIADLPIRLLVGHKGIGKSALFHIAMSEDKDANRVTVLIKPDDVVGLGTSDGDFLRTIRDWKTGLIDLIATKILVSLGATDKLKDRSIHAGGVLLDFVYKTFRDLKEGVDYVPSQRAVIEQFLKERRVVVYIDDLDRGWQGRPGDVSRVSALLNAVRDLARENEGLHFRISLRADVYYLVRTSDESTDKIEGSVVWQSWTNHEIFLLLVKRIETFFGRSVDEITLGQRSQRELADYLGPVMESYFRGKGHWENAPMHRVLMSLIRKRPRDLVKLCTLAAERARRKKSALLLTEHFESIFQEYSQGRVQDTINEFRSELPDVERLLLNMKPSRRERTAKEGYVYKTDALLRKIRDIMETGEFVFSNGKTATAKDLAAFMYKVNFLTARKDTRGAIVRRYFEENRYLSNDFADFGFDWEIHPAYRWALQPTDVAEIYRTLGLTADERELA